MKRFRGMVAVAVILMGAALTQTAQAGTIVQKIQLTGDSVEVYTDKWDDCTNEYFYLHTTTNTTKNENVPPQSGMIYMSIYNSCTGSYASAMNQAVPEWFLLQIQNTRSASLKGTFPMGWRTPEGDYVGYAEVDLQWVATSNPERTSDRTRSSHGDYVYSTRVTGTSANATVTGTIRIDGNPLDLTNSNGRITNSQSGSMEIRRFEGKPVSTP